MSYRAPVTTTAPRALRGSLTPGQVVDLILVAELMIILPGLLSVDLPWLRIPVGLFSVLFAPGYALTAALFPPGAQSDRITRVALSLALSVALIPHLALLLDRLPWGVAPTPMAVALCALTCFFCLVAGVRRYLSAGPYTLLTAPTAPGLPPRLTPRTLLALTTAAVVAVGGLAIYATVLTTPTRLTEFYALGPGGMAEDYPRELTAGEPTAITLGIVNREGEERGYRIEVRSGAATLAAVPAVRVADGASWRQPVRFGLPSAGADQTVDILLFVEGRAEPYRRLQLWINVREQP